jgi:hypothetical protein
MLSDDTEKVTITIEELKDSRIDDALIRKQTEMNIRKVRTHPQQTTYKAELLGKIGLYLFLFFIILMVVIWVIMRFSYPEDVPSPDNKRLHKATLIHDRPEYGPDSKG